MRRFEQVSTVELGQKLISMRGSECAQVLSEFLLRAKESYRDNLEDITNDLVLINLLQGKISLVKELLGLINPKE